MYAVTATVALCLFALPAHALAESSKPCASTATEKEPEWMDGSFEKRSRTGYRWRKSGALAKLETTTINTNPKYGDTSETRSFEHDRAGRPTRLSYAGEVKSPDGKRVVHSQKESWGWTWRGGLLREFSFTRKSEGGRQTITARLSWPADTRAVAPWLEHVALMTWLDASHRDRGQLYAALFGGGAGTPTATITSCREGRYAREEVCEPSKPLELAYDARGRVTRIASAGEVVTVEYGEHGIAKATITAAEARDSTSTAWDYDDAGRLLAVIEKSQLGQERVRTSLRVTRHPDGTVAEQRRVYETKTGTERPYVSETPRHTWSYRCARRR